MTPALLVLLAALAADPAPAVPCAGAVAHDDGKPESGYGFVPSAKWGVHVTELQAADLPSRALKEVCVCWLRTRGGPDVDFEVVFHADEGGRPALDPYATIPGRAVAVPRTKETAGQLYAVDVDGVVVPPGTSWVGVRWDPSVENYAFVCVDQSAETPVVPGFFAEDRSGGWTADVGARDPIYHAHRALVIRATAWTLEEAAKRPSKPLPAPRLVRPTLRPAPAQSAASGAAAIGG